MKLKLLFFDVETAPNLSYHWFGKHEQEIIEIVEEGYMLSFAYKWLGEKSVKSYSLATFKGNRKKLIEKLWELFNEADIVCGHNAKQFDVKWANRAFVFYGLTPPSPFKVVDTLTEARTKFKFNSNRLNDLGTYLKIGNKLETGGFPLWKRCMAGDKKAFALMEKYNRQDIVLLEKIYLRLRPYMNHPKINIEYGQCENCGSKSVVKNGAHILVGGFKKDQYQCKDCGHWFSPFKKYKI